MNTPLETLTLAGGCFWCTEAVYVQVRGVCDVESGYSNGHVQRPSYEQVCAGRSGHAEVVQLQYDPAQVTTRELLEIFFLIHDPTTLNRQGHDTGTQYRSAIYYSTPQQRDVAQALLQELAPLYDQPLVTELQPLDNYWPAEDYHQDFFARNPTQGYCLAVAAPKVAKFRHTFARLQKA